MGRKEEGREEEGEGMGKEKVAEKSMKAGLLGIFWKGDEKSE